MRYCLPVISVLISLTSLAAYADQAAKIPINPLIVAPNTSVMQPDEAALRALYMRMSTAVAQPDNEQWLEFLQGETMPDYRSVDIHGQITSRAEEIESAEAFMTGLGTGQPNKPDEKISFVVTSVVLNGDTAIVRDMEQHNSQIVDTDGIIGKAGKSYKKLKSIPHRDTWVRTSSGWRWKLKEVGKAVITFDGKPAPPPPPTPPGYVPSISDF